MSSCFKGRLSAACLVFALSLACGAQAAPVEALSHGRFENTPVYRPDGAVKRFVLWFADGPDTPQRRQRVQALVGDGAMVAEVDMRHLLGVLGKDPGKCTFSSGDVENYSRYVQAYYKVPGYHLPLLLGDGEGAAWAYAIAAQAPKGAVAAAVSLGFCPMVALPRALCPTQALAYEPAHPGAMQPAALSVPWLVAAGAARPQCPAAQARAFTVAVPQARAIKATAGGDVLPGLRAALVSLGARPGASVAAAPDALKGLPVIEVPASGKAPGDALAIFVSGDGGWAGFDKQVAGRLAQGGLPVVGVDSLRYFWSARTPQGFANDLVRIADYYRQHWNRKRVVLVGFSQGADVLPAAYNHLPEATMQEIPLLALMSFGEKASYEFHVSNWLGKVDDGLPIAPEVAKIPQAKALYFYGSKDGDALCPKLPAAVKAACVQLPGDHHFGGDYNGLAQRILARLDAMPAD